MDEAPDSSTEAPDSYTEEPHHGSEFAFHGLTATTRLEYPCGSSAILNNHLYIPTIRITIQQH